MGKVKGILKGVGYTLRGAVVALSAFGVACVGPYYLSKNNEINKSVNYAGKESVTATKVDLPFGETKIEYDLTSEKITNVKMSRYGGLFRSYSGYRNYSDKDGDGKLDSIYGDFKDSRGLKRNINGLEIEVFKPEDRWVVDEAQQDYEEQMERFKPLLEEKGVWPYKKK